MFEANVTTISTTAPHAAAPLRQVPRRAAPSLAEFRRDFLLADRPVVITDVASKWPAIARWTFDYLGTHARSARVNVRAKHDYGEHGSTRAEIGRAHV